MNPSTQPATTFVSEKGLEVGWVSQDIFKHVHVGVSCLVVSDSLRPHGLQPTRLLRAWDSPGKSTGVGCHFLLQYLRM